MPEVALRHLTTARGGHRTLRGRDGNVLPPNYKIFAIEGRRLDVGSHAKGRHYALICWEAARHVHLGWGATTIGLVSLAYMKGWHNTPISSSLLNNPECSTP